jgi:uncharacterized protein YecA (UPF0149 family)
MAKKELFKYAGDDVFRTQLEKLDLPLTVAQVRERIQASAQGEAVLSPTQLMGELVGEKMQEEELEDAETAQAFALNFLALWNEAVAARPAGEATDAWRAQVQELIEIEAKEVRKPYLAPDKPGRNDPCSCGSGKKYKKCHGV